MGGLTWSQAVQMLREDPEQQALVKACYYDDPLQEAADRFWRSLEWKLISEYLPNVPGDALDLGAGRGISSYALARDGWRVTALEPDPSPLVGAEAIRSLAGETGLPIQVVSDYSETLPFLDGSFDLVHCRQVLHHAQDLLQTCREIGRVLKPGGMMIATREHVISKPEDLQTFLDQHPLHHLYGGENAFMLRDYTHAIRSGGLSIIHTLAPFDSAINYFPATDQQIYNLCLGYLSRLTGKRIATHLVTNSLFGNRVLELCRKASNTINQSPGRLYSFVAIKPHG
ncbi:class I SAM-dependent methyltransferase [Cyanobium sp. N5-Cardenillas]|uniref:class I SAM-dependent methyltransferase n=1 Tax=Cyanobium sp. N5-Cardenillas TaxID=2823720 RepID=UPI0020CD655B|nr:class I SAM-dependent methyltransferase [Cyanobium sp. N5-Cardenillas]MCP9784747.1 class I SAM-dependent methyltransferase [Cyanobium sp. N5-Cardenillas]